MNETTAQKKLRKAVINYRKNHTIEESALLFEIGTDTVVRWENQFKNEGTLLPQKTGGKTYSFVTETGQQFLRSEIEKENDITLQELQTRYLERFNIKLGISTIHYHLKKLGISLKKKASMTPKNIQRKI